MLKNADMKYDNNSRWNMFSSFLVQEKCLFFGCPHFYMHAERVTVGSQVHVPTQCVQTIVKEMSKIYRGEDFININIANHCCLNTKNIKCAKEHNHNLLLERKRNFSNI